MSHFEGKTVAEHLKEARAKGALAAAEIHGTEMPGSLSGGADGAKETAFVLLLLWILFQPVSPTLFFLFSLSWILWKTGRSALLGWARLERLHRLIEEERWEIEHHRHQEREELAALYQAKGLTGKLLDEVVSVLMADDNRLLRIMLEEELGLTLEIQEHPLKQCAGTALGIVLSAALFIGCWHLSPLYGPIASALIVIVIASYVAAKAERNRGLESVVWNLSLAGFSAAAAYFLAKL